MFTTPGGTPASSSTLMRLTAESGVSSDGFNTTVLPHTSAGMIFHDGIAIGKFHGVIIEHTPSGCRSDIANLSRSSDGAVWPCMRRPSAARKYVMSIASCTSPRVSSSTLPISRVMSRAKSSLRAVISCAALNRISARLGAGTSRHESKARRAAPIAASASAAVESAKVPTKSRALAGLRLSSVAPDDAGTHFPPTKLAKVIHESYGIARGQLCTTPTATLFVGLHDGSCHFLGAVHGHFCREFAVFVWRAS